MSETGPRPGAGEVQTFLGPVDPASLGPTLIHEHVFVRNLELERNVPDPEWDADRAVEEAVRKLTALHPLAFGRSSAELTVLGLGRDVGLVTAVAERAPVHLVAATGSYTADVLPLYFQFHGPGRLVDGPEPLVELFVRDIVEGIAGTAVRAGMIKVMTGAAGFTPT